MSSVLSVEPESTTMTSASSVYRITSSSFQQRMTMLIAGDFTVDHLQRTCDDRC